MIKNRKGSTMKITGYFASAIIMAFVFTIFAIPGNVLATDEAAIKTQVKQEAQKFVEEMIALAAQEQDNASGTMEAKLHARAMKQFDFQTFSMLSLGKKYQEFSKDQRARFEQDFSRLIARTYVSRIKGQDMKQVSVEYLEPVVLKTRRNLLRADAPTNLTHDGISTPVTYRMMKRGATTDEKPWKIYDVIIEGVSMTANYREQFRNYISESPEKIIADIQEKLAK